MFFFIFPTTNFDFFKSHYNFILSPANALKLDMAKAFLCGKDLTLSNIKIIDCVVKIDLTFADVKINV